MFQLVLLDNVLDVVHIKIRDMLNPEWRFLNNSNGFVHTSFFTWFVLAVQNVLLRHAGDVSHNHGLDFFDFQLGGNKQGGFLTTGFDPALPLQIITLGDGNKTGISEGQASLATSRGRYLQIELFQPSASANGGHFSGVHGRTDFGFLF